MLEFFLYYQKKAIFLFLQSGKPIVNNADHMACVWCTAGADCGIPLHILNQIAEANATAQVTAKNSRLSK